jgi:cytoskeletal protein CcmA (bactofilin family)
MADTNDTSASMIVGEGVLAKGTFQVPGRAVINGSIEGELIAKDILVGPTGRGVGKFTAETGDIRGEIHDTLITTKSLIVRSTGRVHAAVHYREVEIEKGGRVDGTLSRDSEGPIASASQKSSPRAEPVMAASKA